MNLKKIDISGQVDTLFQAKKDIMKSDMDRCVECECGEQIVNAPLSKGTRDFLAKWNIATFLFSLIVKTFYHFI